MTPPTSPTVSVLLAVYNGEKYVGEAIESVLAQTLKEWELVIVSNGSTDATVRICEQYARADARISVHHLDERGKNRAYNHAYRLARGRFICYFGADDVLPPTSLQRRLEPIAGCAGRLFSTCCLKTISDYEAYNGVVFPKNQTQPNYSGGALLFPRDLAERLFPLPETQPNEDTWTQLHLRTFGELRHVPEPLYTYRLHAANSYGYGVTFERKRAGFLQRMHAFRLFLDAYGHLGHPFLQNEVLPFVRGLEAAERGDIVRVLSTRNLAIMKKAVLVFYCSGWLYSIRHRYFRVFSGGTPGL
jgi:glycosyltransferase involved in cell wall biosynthesis